MKRKEAQVFSLLSEEDIYLFKEGRHFNLYEKMGSHLIQEGDVKGTFFAVWAPNADDVSVIGSFNGWDSETHRLFPRWDHSGIWEGFIPDVKQGDIYKYSIKPKEGGATLVKSDPFAFHWETPPKTASIVWDLNYAWKEKRWIKDRNRLNNLNSPIAIYELHFESWRRKGDHGEMLLTYRDMAEQLPKYIQEMGFTHVEFMPIMEFPFSGSWGYQKVGYFAPTSRFGTPQDFMFLIEALHDAGIGIILDWVPSHFPADPHGLAVFDGTHLFEHQDVRKGFHPDWKSSIFNYGRNEVRAFLISSALFWFDKYHVDGLRLDAVASMLYLDYSRKAGEWIPNEYGGNENLEAVEFLKQLNCAVYERYPYAQTMAEESTSWPMVSKPTYLGGLGFGMKWNMGWMHDTLEYFSKECIHRKYHHNELLFSLLYAFSENFLLPLSHDEVVHGKSSLLGKMPGDDWQKFANLRLLFGYMYAHPGKKLLFMGAEIGQWNEWNHQKSLDWHLLEYDSHQGIQRWVRDLNHLYTSHPAMYQKDFSHQGFEWVDFYDWEKSIISFVRKGNDENDVVVFVCNFTPIVRENYKIGVPKKGVWKEILNSDSHYYGGSDKGNFGSVKTLPFPLHGKNFSLSLTLPPLAIICLAPDSVKELT